MESLKNLQNSSVGMNEIVKISDIPAILRGSNVLVPIKIDITYLGARFVDTFCWNLDSKMTPYQFALRTCHDMNLPSGFHVRISLQIAEQIQSFKIIVSILRAAFLKGMTNACKLYEPQIIVIGIRHNTIDYSDKFIWNPMSSSVTPESFASTTCSDLGLPSEMEPAIAHKIREILFRLMISWMDDPKGIDSILSLNNNANGISGVSNSSNSASNNSSGNSSTNTTVNSAGSNPVNTSSNPNNVTNVTNNSSSSFSTMVSEIKVSLVHPAQAIDMTTNLWKRARPNSVEEQASIPQPILPLDKDSNLSIWANVNV